MIEYFKIQYQIFNRKMEDFGIKPIWAILILTLAFIVISSYLFNYYSFIGYIYTSLAIISTIPLSNIQRNEFMMTCFNRTKYLKIRTIENIIYSSPFILFLIYKKLYLISILTLFASVIMACLKIKNLHNFSFKTPFSHHPFEFPIGFRKSLILISLAYVLSIISVIENNFNLGTFALIMIYCICFSFYANVENEYYIWIFNTTSPKFLIEKIKMSFIFSQLLAMLIAILIGIYFTPNYYVVLLIGF
jgi:hypothetical protein